MPERIGPYEIAGQIGRGGMAVVYLARQPVLGRRVALKELSPFHVRDPSLAQRFLREARVAGSLSHANIVTVHDFFEHDGVPYIAMEYLERRSLRAFVGRMSLAQVVGVLEGLLAALSHAESKGIVHRDVKPENLLITADGEIKIADFGIAKAVHKVVTEEMLTPAGVTVGTPAYMAPEQAMAQELGPWTDLYQTGALAYEMLAGTVPFSSDAGPMALMMQQISDPVPPLPEGTDPALERWVRRLLAKEPAARPASARAAWDELEEIGVAMLGPLWRRDARLGENDPTVEHSEPLTPAQFSSWQDYVPASGARPAAPLPPPPPGRASPPEAPAIVPAEPPRPLARTLAPTAAPAPARRGRKRSPLVPLSALALVAAVIVVLFARGGGQDATPTPTPAAAKTPTPASTPAAAGPFNVGRGADGIAVGAGAVWVAASRDGTLTRIDPQSGHTATVKVGANPDGVIVAFDEVWVSLTDDNQVARVRATALPKLLGTVKVGASPEGLAASSRAIWVANSGDGTVTQILAATHETRTVPGVARQPVDLAIGAGAVWVADSRGASVARVDGNRLRLVRTITGIGPNPRAVAIVGRDVWVATADDGRAWRIDGDAERVSDSVHIGGQPRDITTDGEHLWVTDREGDSVVEIDARSRRVVNREPVGGGPLEVAVDDRAVWVSAFDSGQATRLPR